MGAVRLDRTLPSPRLLLIAEEEFLQRKDQIRALYHSILRFRGLPVPSSLVGGLLRRNTVLFHAQSTGERFMVSSLEESTFYDLATLSSDR